MASIMFIDYSRVSKHIKALELELCREGRSLLKLLL